MTKKLNTVVSEDTTELTEIEKLQKQLDAQNKLIQQLIANQSQPIQTKKVEQEEDDEDDISINGDTYIKVMSLCPHTLNLTTQPKGRGQVYSFTKLFEVKRMPYHYLADIIENHQNFLNEGKFLILNSRVIKRHGLDDLYKNILTKEKMEIIREGNETDAVNLFKTANPTQQSLIVEQMIDDIVQGKPKDLNYLDRLSRIIGFSISERADEVKQLFYSKKEEKE